MPFEVRLFVRTALAFFTLSLLIGVGMTIARHGLGVGVPWYVVVQHTHAALVGGVLLLIMGVAWWMFPLDQRRWPDTRGRWDPRAPRVSWALMTGGLVLRLAGEPFAPPAGGGPWGMLLIVAALLQFAGFAVFAIAIHGRIRSVHTP